MSQDFKKDIDGYFIDYRNDSNKTEFKSYENIKRTVTAQTPKASVQKPKNETIIKQPEKNKKYKNIAKKAKPEKIKKREESIYVNTKPSIKDLVYRVAFGCMILFLTIIGLGIFLSTLSKTASPVNSEVIPSNDYGNFLASVVMHDPEPFDSPQKADKQMVLASSIWRAIFQNGTQKYDRFDERGFSLISVEDIILACHELFGSEYNINTNERIFGPFYTFEPGDENFHICAISNQNSYLPYIKEAVEENEFLNLKVGYVSRDDKFLKPEPLKTAEPSPLKYMKYKLKKNLATNNYYIYAVESIS